MSHHKTVPESVTHVIGSLFSLSHSAGEEIVGSFKAAISAPNVSCEFKDGNYFTLHCPVNDNISLTKLIELVQNFIATEDGKEPEVFEEAKVTRKQGTKFKLTAASSVKFEQPMDNTVNEGANHFLIEFESKSQVWNSNHADRIETHLLGQIESLCRCRLEKLGDTILVKGDTEQDIQKAISKLDTVDKMTADQLSFPHSYSFPILEGELDVSLQIVALKDLDDRRLITTLLPNSSPISKSLKNALVVMAVGRKGVLEVKPNSRTSHSVYAGALWKEYRHRPLGVEKTRQSPELVPIPDVPLSKKWSNKVNIWIEKQVDPTSFVDPHLPDSDVADQIQTTTLRDYKESLAPATKPITKRARTAKGNPEVSRRPPGSEVPIHDTVKDHHSIGRLSSGKQNQLDDQTSLIDASPSEKLQDPGKTQPRDLRRTMQQRTPAPGITGGNTALMKRFERATISLVAFARRCPGQIHLRVDIGRFLIKDQTSSAEFKVRPFNVSEWPSAFPDSSTGVTGFETHFTNMLTTSSSDADSILCVRLSRARRLFLEKPYVRTVTYTFICRTKDNEKIVIESDEDGGYKLRGPEIMIGALNWHFPKRAWDARLRLTCNKFMAIDYHKQAQGIIDNLKISPSADGMTFDLSTETIDQELVINSITLRRTTIHSTTDIVPGLELHLTESQDLAVQAPGPKSLYRGSTATPKAMNKESTRYWWEAAVFSTSACSILSENESLELGNYATWKPEDIIGRGVVRDLFSVTEDVITRIDGVGYYNKSGSGTKTTDRTSDRTQEVPPAMLRASTAYW